MILDLPDGQRAAAGFRVAVARAGWLERTGAADDARELAERLFAFEPLVALPRADRERLLGVLAKVAPVEARFQRCFVTVARAAAAATEPADLEVLFEVLTGVAGWIDELPAEQRAGIDAPDARFFLGTQLADIRLEQRNLDAAAEIAERTRAAARREGIWRGPYRARLLVILWQSLPDDAFGRLLAEERSYLDSEQPLADAAHLEIPLRLLRTDIRFLDGDEERGLRELQDLADEILAAAPLKVVDPWRVQCLSRLAWYFVVRSDYERAERYLGKLPVSEAMYPRAIIALRRGDYEFALRAGKRLAKTDPSYRFLVGEALEGQHEFAAALDEYRAVLAAARDALDRAIALRSLGDCEVALARAQPDAPDRGERLARARAHYEEALRAREGDPHAEAETVQILGRLGRALELAGDLQAAHDRYRRSLRTLDLVRRSVASDPFGSSWLTSAYLEGVDGLLRVGPKLGRDPFELLAALELAKARTLLDWMVVPPRAGAADAAIVTAVRRLARTADPKDLDRQLRGLESARRSAGPAVSGATVLDVAALREHVAAARDTLFLSYWTGAERAWVVWSEGARAGAVELGSRDDALHELASAHAAVADPSSQDPWIALDAAAAWFVPDEIARLVDGCDRVVFCPDDRLGRLPFEALRVGGRSLGIARPVERAASLTVRERLLGRVAHGSGVAVIDSVDAAEDERRLGLDPLEFSAREGDLVARAYGSIERLRGADARLDELERLLGGRAFDVVHVSAHAVDNRYVPTASLLLLADGPAALPSLAGIDLRGAVLVLSACSTATGEERGGEGELGLLGWPFAAGARAALASIWNVNQQATSDLMGQFHAFRADGDDEASAMRAAREVLAATPQYAHPHYWAGFGVWSGAKAERSGASWLPWAGALALLLALAWVALSSRAGADRRSRAAAVTRRSST